MDLGSHEIRRGLLIGVPMLVMLLLGVWRRWLWKKNAAISSTLRRRDN
jgi:type VI protein secretion system component VasK